jgi:hypothetical protein
MKLRYCFGWLLVGLAAPACWEDVSGPCRDGLEVGDKYVVTIGDAEISTAACPAELDLSAGTELLTTVTATDTEGDQCAAGRIEVADFDDWTWTPDTAKPPADGAADLIGEFIAQSADCSGRVIFKVEVGGTACVRRWVPDSAGGSCPAGCYDTFACQVAKAP